jgi:hypothetical protein
VKLVFAARGSVPDFVLEGRHLRRANGLAVALSHESSDWLSGIVVVACHGDRAVAAADDRDFLRQGGGRQVAIRCLDELRNPLSAIRAATDALARLDGPRKGRGA